MTSPPSSPQPDAAPRPIYQVGHLERLPLGTPYPGVVTHVVRMLSKAPLVGNVDLVIDFTGVGRPVFDLFQTRGISPIGVSITAGDAESQDGFIHRVPKLVLISQVQAFLHNGQLRIQKDLPEAAALADELQDFQAAVTDSGYWRFGARSGKHDDLVLALAIALWRARGAVNGEGWLDMAAQKMGITTRYFVGVDLGQAQDPTAIAIVRRTNGATNV